MRDFVQRVADHLSNNPSEWKIGGSWASYRDIMVSCDPVMSTVCVRDKIVRLSSDESAHIKGIIELRITRSTVSLWLWLPIVLVCWGIGVFANHLEDRE